jgi:hypothetical protein
MSIPQAGFELTILEFEKECKGCRYAIHTSYRVAIFIGNACFMFSKYFVQTVVFRKWLPCYQGMACPEIAPIEETGCRCGG